MNRELYFIPILQKAMEAGNVRVALKKAFYEINQLGNHNEYKQGFKNFQAFIREVFVHYSLIKKQSVKDLETYSKLFSATRNLLHRNLSVFRDGSLIDTISLDKDRCQRIQGILPGLYTLCLSTGRMLWSGNFATEDIISETHDGKNIKLAADSKEIAPKYSKRIILLNGLITLKMFKGINAAVMEIGLE